MIARHPTRLRRLPAHVALIALVVAICAGVVFPLYWMLTTSVQTDTALMVPTPSLIPRTLSLQNYAQLFASVPIGLWLRNTLVVALGTVVVSLVLAIFAAYSLSRFRYRGRGFFGLVLLLTQMLPPALFIIPLYMIFRTAHLLDHLVGLILVDSAFLMPIATWVLKGFFDTIPAEIEEAARVDGCSRLGVLRRITLPLALPALVAAAVICFFEAWDEYLFASTLISSQSNWVTSVGLASFIGMLSTPLELVMAAAVVFTIPSVIFFLLMQKYIVSGMTGGAVKG